MARHRSADASGNGDTRGGGNGYDHSTSGVDNTEGQYLTATRLSRSRATRADRSGTSGMLRHGVLVGTLG